MFRNLALGALACTLIAATWVTPEAETSDRVPQVITVKMVDKSLTEYSFEPAVFTVQSGDIVKFVQTSTMPHNVDFRGVPEGTNLNGSRVGPYLTQPDEVYELVIDERFTAGDHEFVCTPHEFMGMKGVMTVESN